MRNRWLVLLLTFFKLSVHAQVKVDCIFYNAHIYSFETMKEVAQAMAVKQGRIVALGTNYQIKKQFKAPQTIDIKQNYMYPSWTDAHGHFTGLGIVATQSNLSHATSLQEIIEICLKSYKNQQTAAIKGWGWNQENFTNKFIPNNDLLNQQFPNIPVFLKRIDGHAALVNQAALSLAGISDTCSVFGNLIEKVNGKPTGILFDAAADTVENYLSQYSTASQIAAMLKAQSICLDYGITMVHDAGIDLTKLHLIDSLQNVGKLHMRINAMLYLTDTAFTFLNNRGAICKSKLHVHGFKMVVDGALGSRGACLKHPYTDKPNWFGTFLQSPLQFERWIQKVALSPFQLSTHAIGDSANAFVMTQYAAVLAEKKQRRWRIEHAQVLDSNLFHFLNGENILPSVQPIHAYSDKNWAIERLGLNRLQYAYAYGSMLKHAGKILIGTDFPIESPNPLKNYWAALGTYTNKSSAFDSIHYIQSQQTFLGMTQWPAYAAFSENELGSLTIGKWADFNIYKENLLQVEAPQLSELKPIAVYIGAVKVK